MGRVKVTAELGHDSVGIPFVSTCYHLYCDRCGSYRIATHISPATRALLLLSLLAAVGVWYHIGKGFFSGAEWLVWWAPFLFFGLIALHESWTYLGHRCCKCGNTRITYRDVLHYGSREEWTYDLPYDRIHKHSMMSDKWYIKLTVVLLGVLALPLIPITLLLMAAASGVHSILKRDRS